jgi:ribonuclease Z
MIVTILGCGSSTPSLWRNPSSQKVEIGEIGVLLDCGEGTALQLLKNKIKYQSIDIVLISHLHGDHFSGLFGLISAMNSSNRTKKLVVFGPLGLSEIISSQSYYSNLKLNFEINFNQTQNIQRHLLIEHNSFKITSFPLNHRVACTGFLFEEKQEDEFRSYAYCSDTLADESYYKYIKDVDLLYHEATFESSLLKWAIQTKHSTASQAAQAAYSNNVRKLLLGHFSSRYKSVDFLIEEASVYFANTFEAIEGESYFV